MKFVKIPENGASWAEPLCYTINTESTLPKDLVVEIVDESAGEVIGIKHLYGVTEADIDIAPYVRRSISATLPAEGSHITISPSARSITVRVEGVSSAARVFFRAKIDCSVGHMLSSFQQQSVVARGEVIRLTVYGQEIVRAWSIDKRTMSYSPVTEIRTAGLPVEIVVQTNMFTGGSVPISVEVQCDGGVPSVFNYTITEPEASTMRVAWHNADGGVECYTFPMAVRMKYEAELSVIDAIAQRHAMLPATMRYRLLSAYESREQMERLIGIVASPEVYECRGDRCEPLQLVSRKIEFDDHGALRRMELIVEKSGRSCL